MTSKAFTILRFMGLGNHPMSIYKHNALDFNGLYIRLINFFKFFLTGIIFFHRLVYDLVL